MKKKERNQIERIVKRMREYSYEQWSGWGHHSISTDWADELEQILSPSVKKVIEKMRNEKGLRQLGYDGIISNAKRWADELEKIVSTSVLNAEKSQKELKE